MNWRSKVTPSANYLPYSPLKLRAHSQKKLLKDDITLYLVYLTKTIKNSKF